MVRTNPRITMTERAFAFSVIALLAAAGLFAFYMGTWT
jgi:hypothetical protein